MNIHDKVFHVTDEFYIRLCSFWGGWKWFNICTPYLEFYKDSTGGKLTCCLDIGLIIFGLEFWYSQK